MASQYRSRSYTPSATYTSSIDWQDGDIAFLKTQEEINRVDTSGLKGYKPFQKGAAGHPVIILEHSKDAKYFLVTTVSAYGSGDHNGNLPPWKQIYHQRKQSGDFRAFVGSEKPHGRQKHLQLEDNKLCPKAKTSWVYVCNYFVVPWSMLKRFDKTPAQLRMTSESLRELLDHMRRRNRNFGDRWSTEQNSKPVAVTPPRSPSITHARPCTPTPTAPKTVQPASNSATTMKTGTVRSWSMVAAGKPASNLVGVTSGELVLSPSEITTTHKVLPLQRATPATQPLGNEILRPQGTLGTLPILSPNTRPRIYQWSITTHRP
ncbi:hypothetical protein F5B20DRAFT_582644 [Whalleya microplaca]|nr:hypothetical protein F5B20DRAFT_582644 [Whalleya microplaca]